MIETLLTYSLLFVSLYFEVFMLVAFLERRRHARSGVQTEGDSTLPSVAIVVPCFNEEKTVEATVRSLLALEYPADKLEILIVDDGSTDATLPIMQQFENPRQGGNFFGEDCLSPVLGASFADEKIASLPRVRIFHKENGGKHTAMNLALSHTQADLIGCLDADSIVAPEALLHMARVFGNKDVAAATPGIFIKKPETLLQYMQEAEYRFSIFSRFTLAAIGSAFITPGPFSLFRRSVVEESGGWQHGYSTEDLEMALRIQDKGYLIANVPGAIVHTGTPRTLRALFRQRVRWTYGFLRNAIDYRHMFGNRAYGNLGLIILPMGVASIFIALFFFLRIVYFAILALSKEIVRIEVAGWHLHPSFSFFYINTSALWFLIYFSVIIVLMLIAMGSFIGTGRRSLPPGTPLFVLMYCFVVPLWLGTAVVRAVFKTGVRWR